MAEKGNAFLLNRGDGATPEVFTTIAGLRSTSFNINGETVDVTDKLSGGNRVLLSGAGVSSMSISGSGVFQNDADTVAMRQAAFDRTIGNYQIVFGTGGKYEGAFQATSVDQGGEFNGEVTYSVSLESSGPITFTP